MSEKKDFLQICSTEEQFFRLLNSICQLSTALFMNSITTYQMMNVLISVVFYNQFFLKQIYFIFKIEGRITRALVRLLEPITAVSEELSGFIFFKFISLQDLLRFINWVNISAHSHCRYGRRNKRKSIFQCIHTAGRWEIIWDLSQKAEGFIEKCQ